MAANNSDIIAPKLVSVAERIAALQKGKDVIDTYKQTAAHKLKVATAAWPSTEVPKRTNNALADRIIMFQSTAEIRGEYSSHVSPSERLRPKSAHPRQTNSIKSSKSCRATRPRRPSVLNTKCSVDNVNRKSMVVEQEPTPVRKNISYYRKSNDDDKDGDSSAFGGGSQPACQNNTDIRRKYHGPACSEAKAAQSIAIDNSFLWKVDLIEGIFLNEIKGMEDKFASLMPACMTKSEAHVVTPPKPKRQIPILKDVSNIVRNTTNVEENVFNLPTKTNKKLSQDDDDDGTEIGNRSMSEDQMAAESSLDISQLPDEGIVDRIEGIFLNGIEGMEDSLASLAPGCIRVEF